MENVNFDDFLHAFFWNLAVNELITDTMQNTFFYLIAKPEKSFAIK